MPHIQAGFKGSGPGGQDLALYPSECRETGLSYSGLLSVDLIRKVGEMPEEVFTRRLGLVPIMVKSNKCHLAGLSPAELIRRKEEQYEWGGYFIINGNERIIRMLVQSRSNYVLAIRRSAYTNRGPKYTNMGCYIRCIRPDTSSQTVTVHYLKDGTCTLRFSYRRQEFFLPVVLLLKALVATSDREIYEKICEGNLDNTLLTDRVEVLLRDHHQYNVHGREQCLAFIGAKFRVAMMNYPKDLSDAEVASRLIEDHIFVHLPGNPRAKYDLLIFMIRKLYSLVNNEIAEDNTDSPINFEVLLAGHLYVNLLKERLTEWLEACKTAISRERSLDITNSMCDFIFAFFCIFVFLYIFGCPSPLSTAFCDRRRSGSFNK